MHSFLDSKAMAKALRAALAERHIDIGHSDSLELVARQFGFANWNILAARIDATSEPLSLPAGWIIDGTAPQYYRLGIDPEVVGAVRIERIKGTEISDAQSFATLMQSIDAAAYVGRTLRLSAELMSRSAGKGSLWIRVDPAPGGRALRFDNMFRRANDGPLSGDMGWTKRSIAFDVPREAHAIHYGVMLLGPGTVWARSMRLDDVDQAEIGIGHDLPRGPVNLGFSDAA